MEDGRWKMEDGSVNSRAPGSRLRAPGSGLTFAYDYLGRRIRKEIYQPASSDTPAKTIRYVWDGWHCVAKLDLSDSEGYFWGPDVTNTIGGAGGVGGLVGVVELSSETGSGTRIHFPTFDASGNVTSLVSEYPGYTGYNEVTARYEYDPFGVELRRSGPYADANTWRFSTAMSSASSSMAHRSTKFDHGVRQPSFGSFRQLDQCACDSIKHTTSGRS